MKYLRLSLFAFILFNFSPTEALKYSVALEQRQNIDKVNHIAGCGCGKIERGPTGSTGPSGPTGPTGPEGICDCTPIFASYSLPWPPGAYDVNTYEPIPFTGLGLNASFPVVGGIQLNSTTHIFTIPVSGYYEISYGFSSAWSSGTIVGLGIFTGVIPVFNNIVPNSSIPQGIGAQYQMTSGTIIIPLAAGTQIALINTNDGGGGNVPTDFLGLAPYPDLDDQEQSAAYITFKKLGDF